MLTKCVCVLLNVKVKVGSGGIQSLLSRTRQKYLNICVCCVELSGHDADVACS